MATCFRPQSLEAVPDSLLATIRDVHRTQAVARAKRTAATSNWGPGVIMGKKERVRHPLMAFVWPSVDRCWTKNPSDRNHVLRSYPLRPSRPEHSRNPLATRIAIDQNSELPDQQLGHSYENIDLKRFFLAWVGLQNETDQNILFFLRLGIGVVVFENDPISRRKHRLRLWAAQGQSWVEHLRFHIGKRVVHGGKWTGGCRNSHTR
jgi:hypothetical protein